MKNLRGAPDMVRVVVTCDVAVDPVDPERLKIGNRFVADALPSILEEDGFTQGRDQQSAVALTDVDEVELKVPVGLADQRVVEEQTEAISE